MQLLIIDVQNTYRKWCHNLIDKIPLIAENYSDIIYLYDTTDGTEWSEEVPEEWMEEECESFYCRLNAITKQYAFFRGLLDAGVDEDNEEIIKLGKFLIKNNLTDAREIEDDSKIKAQYLKEFKNSSLLNINFNDYSFYLPDDLIQDITERVRPGVTLVGGARNECLKEIRVLLDILDVPYTVLEEYTY